MAMEHAEDHVYGLQWHPEVCEPCRVHLTVLLCEGLPEFQFPGGH